MPLSLRHCLLIACTIALAFCFPARAAQAESLYRCVARDGAVSYQTQPCSKGQRLDRIVDYQPVPANLAEAAPEQPRAEARQRRRTAARIVRSPRRHATAYERCQAAKAKRGSTLRRLGLRRTYDHLSRLDAQVRAVCDD
ncbi:MAG: DUF4124 domain-containing protein [Thermomonas sp.]|nr:DUF4124 domain-containing protein [Thermomonas sp.]